MASKKVSELEELEILADDDELMVVDKSDTTMAASGTNKKVKASNIKAGVEPVERPLPASVSILDETGDLNGSFIYQVSYYTVDGETDAGGDSGSVAPANQQVTVTLPISEDNRVVGRRIYRSGNHSDAVLKQMVVDIPNNTTTTYVDNIPNEELGAYVPRVNTTGGLITRNGARVGIVDKSSTSFGYGAMPNNTGYANSAFGLSALGANTIGYRNAAFGVYALENNITGYGNSAFGVHSLGANTEGISNSAFGFGALQSNTTGNYNTAVGVSSLSSNTTASGNTAFGFSALLSTTVGSANIAFGQFALENADSYSNCAIGVTALRYLTDGNFNTAIGQGSSENHNGNFSTAIGYYAFQSGSHGNSVAIGAYAGAYETEGAVMFIDAYNRETEARGRNESMMYGKFHHNDITQQWLQLNATLIINGRQRLKTSTEPDTPASGEIALFFDGTNLKSKKSDGTVNTII